MSGVNFFQILFDIVKDLSSNRDLDNMELNDFMDSEISKSYGNPLDDQSKSWVSAIQTAYQKHDAELENLEFEYFENSSNHNRTWKDFLHDNPIYRH